MMKVVMGYLLDGNGKILVAKRDASKNFGGLWEFPGGKVEGGETASQAIIRELREELGVEVMPIREFPPYVFRQGRLEIAFYPIHCQIIEGEPEALEHVEIRMVNTEEFSRFEFAPPDYEALEILLENLPAMKGG
ncbi:MAG: (deoxy)nucleoside triphosphate pyrophosphohydrolase [Verrucomicrobiota bacterium]